METITENLRKVKLSSTEDNPGRNSGTIKKQTEEEADTKLTKNDVIHLYDICCGNLFLDSKSVLSINGWFCGLQKIELRWICSRCGHVQCSCYGEDSFFASQDYQSQGSLQVKARFNFDDSTGVGMVWCYDQRILSSLLQLSAIDWKHLTKAVLDQGGYFATEIKTLANQEETCKSYRMSYLKTFISYCGHPCLQRQVQLKCTLMHAMHSRRSRRRQPVVQDEAEYINRTDRRGFCVQQVENKGRGVITTEAFKKGQFLLQYYGKLTTWEEGDCLEEENSSGYRFFFKYRGESYCIDATEEPKEGPMLGRLVNHGEKKERNTKLQIVNFNDKPALCLYAMKDIEEGEEILYDYGVANLPWKKKKYPDEPERNDSSKAEKFIDNSTNSSRQKYDQAPLADSRVEVTEDVERLDHGNLPTGLLTKTTEASPSGPDDDFAEDTAEFTEQVINPSCGRLAQNLSTGLSTEVYEDVVNLPLFEIPQQSISSDPATECNDMDPSHKRPDPSLPSGKVMEVTKNAVDPSCKASDQSLSLGLATGMNCINSPCQKPEGSQLPSGEVMEVIKDAVDPSFKASDQSLSLGSVTEMNLMDPLNENPEQSLPLGEVIEVFKDALNPLCNASYQSVSLGPVSEVNDVDPSCGKADKSQSSGQVMEVIEEATIDPLFETCDQDPSFSSLTVEVPEPCEVSETESALDAAPTAAEAWESDVDSSEESSDDSAEESFVPDSEDSSSYESEDIPVIPMPTRKQASATKPTEKKIIKPAGKKVAKQTEKEVSKPAEEKVMQDSKVYVMTTNNTPTSRSYDKPAYCFVCSRPQKKLTVHIIQHKDETLVAQWLAATGNEKDKLWTKIRNLGNHLHNYEVLEAGEGPLIVVYRPKGYAVPTDYQPCVDCLGYYSCSEFYRHKCKLRNPEKETDEKKRRTLVKHSRLLLPPPKGCKEGDSVHRVLGTLRMDEISCCIKGDPLIVDFAKKLVFKHGHDQEQYSCLRTKLRQVARLVLEFRLTSEIKDASLSDLFLPSRFGAVITAVRSLAGFDDEMHTYTKPSLAIKIGQSLKKVAMMLVSRALIEGDTTKEREGRDVHTLLTENWDVEVSSHALRTLYQGKRNNPKLLPLTSDVVLLTKYLKEESVNSMDNLAAAKAPDQVQNAWKKLANIIVTQLMLFNRKRQGEISKLTLEDYSNIKKGESHVLDVKTLTKFEQDLVKVMWRVEIEGKRGRTVPVLITDEMKKSLDELVKLRSDVGVSSNNHFVFAVLEGSNHHIRGCDALRTFSATCGAKRPDLLRSTQLRKHVAVMSQIMALKENELDVLANFLGHDVRIHREYYRLPDPALQVAKVSKLLVALEGDAGDPGKLLRGKSLDELEITPDEEIEEDQCYDSDNEETEENDNHPLSEPSQAGSKHTIDSEEVTESPKPIKSTHGKKAAPSKIKPKKVPWTDEERTAVMRHFGKYVTLQKLPGKDEIQAVITKENCLKNRTWRNIKDFVRNKITSKARKAERNYMF